MRRPVQSLVSLWVAVTTVIAGCPASQPTRPVVPKPVTAQLAAPVAPPGRPQVELSSPSVTGAMAIDLETAAVVATAGVQTSDLSASETRALLARLEPLPAVTGPAPVMRPPSAMPPGAGTISPIAFVAPTGNAVTDKPASRAAVIATTLDAPQILSFGDVPAESEIRVRFAEPMVAITKVDTNAGVVATIEPAVAGTWKWTDTRVATFTARSPRLAQATEYKVTVPAGAKALSGAVLAAPQVSTFSTPPISVLGLYPAPVAMRPDAPIAVQLDQDFDPAKIASMLRVTTSKRQLAFTTTTLETAKPLWERNPLFGFDATSLGTRYVVIAPVAGTWPAGASLDVTLAKGAPSREGPRITTLESRRSASIVNAFRVLGLDCDYEGRPRIVSTCPEHTLANVTFSNELDDKVFRATMIQTDHEPLEDRAVSGRDVR